MTGLFDAIIVGGGAAGIAAARRLDQRGRSVLIVEAMHRLGGRAHTAMAGGYPADLGCGWLHSADRNPLTVLAERRGEPIDRTEAAWQRQLNDADFSACEQQAARSAYETFCRLLRENPPPTDRASDAIDPGHPWKAFIDNLSTLLNGTELDTLSAADFVAYDSAASPLDWRLPRGLGAFIVSLGENLPHVLRTKVHSIALNKNVSLGTDRGTLRARTVIVTVSTAVLACGKIVFPTAAADHLHAASRLPLGLADKLYLELADPAIVPAETHLFGNVRDVRSGSYYIRPFGRPLIEAFFGGQLACDLESGGSDEATEFALDELAGLLGSGIRGHLRPIRATAWRREPSIGGSYSHALPGASGQRRRLAEPVNDRLCFAGEACSANDFSTVHGAWESGCAAADWAERSLGGTIG